MDFFSFLAITSMIHSVHDIFFPNLSLENNGYLWKNPSRVLCSPMNTKANKIKTTKRIFDLQNFISLLDFYGMSGCPSHESNPLFIDSYDCVDNWGDFFGSKETGFLLFYIMLGVWINDFFLPIWIIFMIRKVSD